ncbi:MAG: DUF4367 domain-containing protein [Syntrophomonadaceae bacterium]|nr:DUF4367 domain-containing protein [Syntrophomonadaceae bacterium]
MNNKAIKPDAARQEFKQKLYEEYEDSLFRLAAFHTLEREGEMWRREMEEIPPEERLYPSAAQLKHMRRQLDKELNRQQWSRRRQRATRLVNVAAVIVLAFAIVSTTLVMNVEAVRQRVYNVLLVKQPESTLFQLEAASPEETAAVMAASPGYWPGYVPEGYSLIKRETNGGNTRTVYMCGDDKYLNLTVLSPDANVYLDSENADREETIYINGNEGLLIEKYGQYSLTWAADGHIFTLRCPLSLEETVKIAESLSYQEI